MCHFMAFGTAKMLNKSDCKITKWMIEWIDNFTFKFQSINQLSLIEVRGFYEKIENALIQKEKTTKQIRIRIRRPTHKGVS